MRDRPELLMLIVFAFIHVMAVAVVVKAFFHASNGNYLGAIVGLAILYAIHESISFLKRWWAP